MIKLLLKNIHHEWYEILQASLGSVSSDYLGYLLTHDNWLPQKENLFAAFTQPLTATKYILLGESPYPRVKSANGYAFWDDGVVNIWGPNGFSKEVNRATSLRNFLKMLLIARGDLTSNDYSQKAIIQLDKNNFYQTLKGFFHHLICQGFLLLNASLVFTTKKEVKFHNDQWQPFMQNLFAYLQESKPQLKLLLFGRFAKAVLGKMIQLPQNSSNLQKKIILNNKHSKDLYQDVNDYGFQECIIAPHPFNLSFITNEKVLSFFKPLDLLNNNGDFNNG